MNKKMILAGLFAFGSMGAASLGSAVAGEWYLNPRACPDLREDVRDRRIDEGRRDRREDRRDERIVDCPASAYTYVASRHELRRGDRLPARPRFERVYKTKGGQYVGVTRRGQRVAINVRPNHDYRGGRYAGRYDR
ncbi:hypothetical protein [Parvularcula sp. LCG005]|uniref:hypothetical protein n=1 Tax=Parvularcula sp. LCG005 TaxID=3078805 RepID=UPI0029421D9C|nr:hypothetical protein [Parvularcula sp. LCG005]WOI53429.1 hypothetical protein RUI03_00195 [Parvularcula sp. LCG005]